MSRLFKYKFSTSLLLLHAVLTRARVVLPGELCGENNTCVSDANRTSYELRFAGSEGCHTTYCCDAHVTKLCTECDATGSCVRSGFVIQHWTGKQAVQLVLALVISMLFTGLLIFVLNMFGLTCVHPSVDQFRTCAANVGINDWFSNTSRGAGTTSDSNTDAYNRQSSLAIAKRVGERKSDVLPVVETSHAERALAKRQNNVPRFKQMNGTSAIQENPEDDYPLQPRSCIADLVYIVYFLVCLVIFLAAYEVLVLRCASDDQQKVNVFGFSCYNFVSANDYSYAFALALIPPIFWMGFFRLVVQFGVGFCCNFDACDEADNYLVSSYR